MEIILYKKEDGGVGYIYNGSEYYSLEEIAVLDVPKGAEWKIVDEEELPQDYTFRDAWMWNNGKVDVSVERAKDIIRQQFRELREPLLQALDLAYMRAIEAKDVKLQEEITNKKQALRDVTAIDMPNDIEALKAFKPEILQQPTQ